MTAIARTSRTTWALFLTLLAAVFAASLHAQTSSATLSGTVHDTSNAVLPKAVVTLTNSSTGVSRKVNADDQGRYSFSNVEPGSYELRVQQPGFRVVVQKDVVLTVGGSRVLDLTMQVGAVSESVLVTTEAPLIEVASPNLSRVVDERAIDSLPILGRNFVDFAELSSGVTPGRENVGGGAFKEPDSGVGQAAAPRLSFAGQPELDTMILVDGAQNVQTFTGLPRVTPSQEAVQEFRILNSTYSSEYGRATGGFVNIVTKSGTNEYHGSGYFFGMNQALNAPYQLNPADPRLQQNQFGATLGGPVATDKTFFFMNYEGQRRAQTNQYSTVVLNNIAAINASKASLGLTPENLGLLRTGDYDGFLGKLDQHFTSNNTLSIRYNLLHSVTDGFLGGNGRGSPAPSTARNNTVLDQTVVANDTQIFSTNLVNETRFSFGRRNFNFPPAANDPDLEVPDLLLTGKSTSDVDFYRENTVEIGDTLSWQHGAHQFKFGPDFNYYVDSYQWALFFPARALFSNFSCFLGQEPACANSFGAPANIAPFNNGLPVPNQFWLSVQQGATSFPGVTVNSAGGRNIFTQDIPSAFLPQTFSGINHGAYGFFAQDQWRLNSKLNLTYGLRYDLETYPSMYIVHEPHNGFQPRLGFAYSPTKRTVIRAGFGLFDGSLVSSVGQNLVTGQWDGEGTFPNAAALAQQFGYSGLAPLNGRFPIAIQPPILGLTTPQASLQNFVTTGHAPCLLPLGVFLSPPGPPNFGNCPPGTPPVAFPAFSIGPDSNLAIPYTEQASLKISQEIGKNVAVSVSYLYVHAIHQGAISGNLNAQQIGTVDGGKACFGVAIVAGACQEPTNAIFPNLGTLFYVVDSGGMSVYNGGTAEIEKRYSHGFSLHGSYTYSRTISNYESVANLADIPQSTNRNLERAASRQSIPQKFTFDLVSAVPHTVPLLHDFKFSTLLDAQSGEFFNVFAGLDTNGDTNTLNNRPGTLGRDTLKGPSIFSWDMRVARGVHFNERFTGEFTFDFFNVINRVNVSDLNTVCECDLAASAFSKSTLSSTIAALNPLFGFNTPRQTLNPFQFQYGFKVHF
ncbi:MAG TPA: TonB-dependent receptor [Candidatus Angelobacter sp.]|nr:TonB-dependent receptor [Candidatus Angelobacter sp.]